MNAPPDDYDDYDEAECWNCGGEGYVYGCSWGWQCDTYDEGEGSCLCTSRCGFCNPAPRNRELDRIMADSLASCDTQPKAGDASSAAPLVSGAVPSASEADAPPPSPPDDRNPSL